MAENKIITDARITSIRAWKVDTNAVPPGCAPAGPGALTVWVDGVPAPQGSKRHVGRGVMIESSKKLKPWRVAVADSFRARPYGASVLTTFPKGTPVVVKIVFVLPRTKAMGIRPSSDFPLVQKPDVDKLIRGVLDSIGHVGNVWGDDSQVVTTAAHKRRGESGEPTGALIHVEAVQAGTGPQSALVLDTLTGRGAMTVTGPVTSLVLDTLTGRTLVDTAVCCAAGGEAAPEPCSWHPRPVDHAQCSCGHFSGAHLPPVSNPEDGAAMSCFVSGCICHAFAPSTVSAVE